MSQKTKKKRLTRDWRVRTCKDEAVAPQDWVQTLTLETRFSPLTLKVCWQRELRDSAAIQQFLFPKLEMLKDPFTMADMPKAIQRLADARDAGEELFVFGDYDVDGTSGAALLYLALSEFGYRVTVRQPDRFKDGYGLNVRAVEEAHAMGFKILVTVDCGISSFLAAEKARELGIDLIILDHHQIDPEKGLPQAFAVVNAQRSDCPSELKELCGCGVAFYALRALRSEGRNRKWWEPGKEPNLKQHLDLLVLATAADLVPLRGDNHILVRHGLEILKSTKKAGLKALMEAAGLKMSDLSPGHLGFVLGPRINASGRMGTANLAFRVLTSQDPVEAQSMARELEQINAERAQIQNKIWDEVRARIEDGISKGMYQHGIAVADPSWHEGVVGIVASRVTEAFQKPAVVISLREDHAKGSARTWGGKDVLEALRKCHDLLLGYGGHKHAAGVSVSKENLDAFVKKFDEAVGSLEQEAHSLPLYVEGNARIEDFNLRTLQELEKLGPFGPGNPEPVFVIRAGVKSHRVLKERHLKLSLTEDPKKNNDMTMDAIWFHAAEDESLFTDDKLTQVADWAAVPEINRFRGNMTPTLRVKDRKATTSTEQ